MGAEAPYHRRTDTVGESIFSKEMAKTLLGKAEDNVRSLAASKSHRQDRW